jgi:hypothetical protein
MKVKWESGAFEPRSCAATVTEFCARATAGARPSSRTAAVARLALTATAWVRWLCWAKTVLLDPWWRSPGTMSAPGNSAILVRFASAGAVRE